MDMDGRMDVCVCVESLGGRCQAKTVLKYVYIDGMVFSGPATTPGHETSRGFVDLQYKT